jgi:7-carboxy-7-deazaguanine synthase
MNLKIGEQSGIFQGQGGEYTLKLVEVADTWQGEGPNTGRQMLITRFKHCNRHCKFCDTWIKMKTSAEGSYSISDINQALMKTKALMITGGEPTLQTDDIRNLEQTLWMLEFCDYQLANIETNGFAIDALIMAIERTTNIDPSKINIIWSPKIFNENDLNVERTKIGCILENPMVYVKIVADGNEWSEKFIREVSARTTDRGKVYLMTLGTSVKELESNFEYCVDLADACNANLSSRMHIMNGFV